MQVGFGKRFVFVANTKTASTSIETALMPYSDIVLAGTPQRKHTSLDAALRRYPLIFNAPRYRPEHCFKFGVMRDPVDWICSWYRYRAGNHVESALPANMSFVEFWARKDWNIQRRDGSRNLQRDMFIAPDGTILADVIIPYSRVGVMFGEICDLLEINRPLPRQNVSTRAETGWIPEALLEELREFYAEDYALFERLDEINAQGMERLRAGGGFVSHPAYTTAPQRA